MNYLIKLTPHKHFFFSPNSGSELGNKSNYYKESLFFPQQTTILGFLRHQLLIQNKLITPFEKAISVKNHSIATELIGTESFNGKLHQTFGCINSISPVTIIDGKGKLLHLHKKEWANDTKDAENPVKKTIFNFQPSYLANLNPFDFKENVSLSPLKNYKYKDKFKEIFISDFGEKYTFKDIFYKHTQVGISKSYKEKTMDNAYYKYIFKGLKEGFSFSFKLDLQERFSKGIVNFSQQAHSNFATEKSIFNIEVKKMHELESPEVANINKTVFGEDSTSNKFIALSDIFWHEQEFKLTDYCDFILSDTNEFNNVRTQTTQTSGFRKNHVNTLNIVPCITRGSIFYVKPNNKETFLNLLKQSPFFKIGYNYLTPIKD